MVQKRLSRTGNSLALILDKPLLDRIQIDEDTPLDVTDDGEVIIISKARDKRREKKLSAGMADAHRRYGSVFRNLAK